MGDHCTTAPDVHHLYAQTHIRKDELIVPHYSNKRTAKYCLIHLYQLDMHSKFILLHTLIQKRACAKLLDGLDRSVAVVVVAVWCVDHPQSPKHQVAQPSTQNDGKEQPEVVRHDNQHEEVTNGNLHHMEEGLQNVKSIFNCIHLGSEQEREEKGRWRTCTVAGLQSQCQPYENVASNVHGHHMPWYLLSHSELRTFVHTASHTRMP